MLHYIKNYIKYKLAGEELKELALIKRRASEVKIWCSHLPSVSYAAEYIENPTKYPYHSLGYHGSIADFRRFIEKVDKVY